MPRYDGNTRTDQIKKWKRRMKRRAAKREARLKRDPKRRRQQSKGE